MAKKKKKSPNSLAKWRADLTLSEPFGLVLTVCLPRPKSLAKTAAAKNNDSSAHHGRAHPSVRIGDQSSMDSTLQTGPRPDPVCVHTPRDRGHLTL